MAAPASGTRAVASGLVERLTRHAEADANFWDFGSARKRTQAHALFPYPAMMVPELQGTLLDDLLASDPTVEWCYDPFAGSGTVLTESMRRGLAFVGGDINPFAVLLLTVKARPLTTRTLNKAVDRVVAQARAGVAPAQVAFRGRDKWFTGPVGEDLDRLHVAIRAERGRDARRFLWVCLAGVVRLVSNSRTSTFKLHSYPEEHLRGRVLDPVGVFRELASEAVEQVGQQRLDLVADSRLLRNGRYNGQLHLRQGDVLDGSGWPAGLRADVLMTSPPYGDNRTTVPYGQHSFLPLMWIDGADLPRTVNLESLLATPYRIDNASIGGRPAPSSRERRNELEARSPALADTARVLEQLSGDGFDRFMAFCSDLDAAIDAIFPRLRAGAIQFWTLGNRRISGELIPTSSIVNELATSRGAAHLTTLDRRFPRNARRMAARNDTVPLMDTEQILVMQSSS